MIGSLLERAPSTESAGDLADTPARRFGRTRLDFFEIGLALLGFAALCVLVLTKASQLLEPDDYAYRASIVALSQGHLLLSTAQYEALARQLGSGGSGIVQWVHLPSGKWISEKNPGYPFFAVVFQLLGIIRLAPLFYGGLACLGLFAGARRWLGRFGGTFAVLLFCTSGAAITFAWRSTMPTFTDASLIAFGAGALLWAMLAVEAPRLPRLLAGIAAFLALEGATFIRYTDVVELGVAVAAVLLFARRSGITWATVVAWMSTVALFAAGIAAFDTFVYGSPLKSGYASGEIMFSLSAVVPNLEHMPASLVAAMPMVVIAAVALVWIAVRLPRDRTGTPAATRLAHRRDGIVAGVLLAGWGAIWALYLAYTWTTGQVGANSVHVIRFYVPALGLIALLAAWTLKNLPRWVSLGAVVGVLVLGVLSFHGLAAAGAGGPGFGPGGPGAPGGIPGGARPPGAPGGSGSLPPGAPPGGSGAGSPP
jgi:hypothetical protein